MHRTYLMLRLCLASGLALGVQTGQPTAGTADPRSAFAAFVDDYFDAYFAWNPSQGTAAGFHSYDAKLEDRSASAVAQRIATAKKMQNRVEKLRQGNLTAEEAIDAEVLDGQLRAELLDLETLANWRKNPIPYIALPGDAVDGLMKRTFASPADRLRSVIARLKSVPALLGALRANVENPPREFTDLAILTAYSHLYTRYRPQGNA